jgi:predicted regulator of Ras-like GTPase activity (Roadblock/LC7/MglB family)
MPKGAGKLKEILEELLKVEGVTAAVVVGKDGFVIESAATTKKIDIDTVGAMASTGMGAAVSMGTELQKGEMVQTLIEMDKGPIILSPLSSDALIAIVADTTANSGRIRYDLKKNRERLVAAL